MSNSLIFENMADMKGVKNKTVACVYYQALTLVDIDTGKLSHTSIWWNCSYCEVGPSCGEIWCYSNLKKKTVEQRKTHIPFYVFY